MEEIEREEAGLSPFSGDTEEPGDVLRRLEVYEDLNTQHGRYASLLERAIEHRRSVREYIFAKVRQEYETKKASLERDRDKLGQLLRDNLEAFVLEREKIDDASRQGQDRLEEIDFRVLLGEHAAETMVEERDALSRSLEQQAEELERTEEILRAYTRVGLAPGFPHASDPSDPEVPPDTEEPGGTYSPDTGEPPPSTVSPGEVMGRGAHGSLRTDTPAHSEASQQVPEAFEVLIQSADTFDEDCPVVQCMDPAAQKGVDGNPGFRGHGEDPGASPGNTHPGFVNGYLVAVQGSRRGERFPLLCSNITLGTSPGSDIRLTDPGIRNFHAQIHFKGRKHYLENLDIMGASFLNGLQGGLLELKDGDIIRLGEVQFQVEFSNVN